MLLRPFTDGHSHSCLLKSWRGPRTVSQRPPAFQPCPKRQLDLWMALTGRSCDSLTWGAIKHLCQP